jgi:CO dehydrogenase maturation factor
MKICICGKGGSGKSTVVALLADELRRRERQVLVIDSDESNEGLYWMLGFASPPVPLMELAGGKKNVQRALRDAFLAEGEYQATPVLAREEIHPDDLPPEHVCQARGLRLVCIGKIHQALEGCACPMGVLCREFLKKLRTGDHEVVVVDMEAGVEHFGRGVETSVDAVVVVVEPSRESVGLAERVKDLASGAGAPFAGAILNKVHTEAVTAQLGEALNRRGVSTLATIPYRQELLQWALEGSPFTGSSESLALPSLADAILPAAERGQKSG